MKRANFGRIHRILKDLLLVLRRNDSTKSQSKSTLDLGGAATKMIRGRFIVPISWLFDGDRSHGVNEQKFDSSDPNAMTTDETNELYELLQRIQLPMVSTQHTLTLLALTSSLSKIQEQQRNLDIPGTKIIIAMPK